jgi:hypothetical protein
MQHIRYALAEEGFSDAFLQARVPNAASEMRSRSKGVLLLCTLVRELAGDVAFHSESGVYLFSAPAPSSARVQEIAAREVGPERLTMLERALPPKDFFVANPAMHAAQISLEFGLHGPWMTFHTPQHGFSQACHYARGELRDGTVPGAVLAAIHMPLSGSQGLFVQYATSADELLDPGTQSLIDLLERMRTDEPSSNSRL